MKKLITATLALLVLSSASLAQYGGNAAVATNSTWGLIIGDIGDQADLNIITTNVEARLAAEEVATTDIAAQMVTETNAARVAEGALSARIITETNRAQVAESRLQGGAATSLQVIAFSPIYSATPSLTCTFVGASTHRLYVSAIDATNAVVTDADGQTTTEFNWISIPKTQ